MVNKRNKRIIVIGGNAAGPSAAAKAKRVNPDAEILMINSEPFISTGTCEMPYVISGEIANSSKIVFFDENSFYEKKGVEVLPGHTVESINNKEKTISVRNNRSCAARELKYDKLILATGSKAKKLTGLEGNPENLFKLKYITDLNAITGFIEKHKPKKAVIIGSGYIGLETAEAFLKRNIDVTIIDRNNLPFHSAEEQISYLLEDNLRKNNIEFIGGFNRLKFRTENGKLINLNIDGRIIEAGIYLSAIGFEPNSDLAVGAGLKTGNFGGISVDKYLRTSDPDIYAAGDCIEVINYITVKPDYFPVATTAHEYGHIAGENAAGGNIIAEPVVKNIAVKILDNVFASAGLTEKEADKYGFNSDSIHAVANNIIPVMPGSSKVFGKIVFEKKSGKILGASFFGGGEVTGYADIISVLIRQKESVSTLTKINFNYTPPNSPFIHLLSILGKKAKDSL